MDFLINVKSKWDTASVQAYAAEVEKAIARIQRATSRAQGANGGQGRPATQQEQASLQGEYLRNEANIRTLNQDKGLPPAEKAAALKVAETNRRAFQVQAQTAGVTLVAGQAKRKAVNEILAINRQADAAERATAEERLKNSRRKRTPPGEPPGAEEQRRRDEERTKTPTPPKEPSAAVLREKRIADEKEQKLRGQERERLRQNAAGASHPEFDPDLTYAERQRILAPGLKEQQRERDRYSGKKGGIKGDIQYNREAIEPESELGQLIREAADLQARVNAIKFRIQEAVGQELRLTEEAVRLTAKEVASRARFGGNVDRLLGAQPKAINTFANAKDQANQKREKIDTRLGQIEDDALRPRGPRIDPRSGKRIPPPPGSPEAIAREEAVIAANVRKMGVAAGRAARSWGAIAEDAAALEAQDRASRTRSYARSQADAPRLQAEVEGKQFRQIQAVREKAQKELDRALPTTSAGQAADTVGEIFRTSAQSNARARRADEARAVRRRRANDQQDAEDLANMRRVLGSNRRLAALRTRQEKADQKKADAAEKAAREYQEQQARLNAPTSWWQRMEARARPSGGGGGGPADRPTFGQTVGSGIFTAARFGIGAGILYGGLNTIKETIKQASDLERVFNQIQRQFEATGRAADFTNFRNQIMEISKDTGQLATEVAFVGFQFQGAFGNGPGGAAYALEQTRAAIEIAKVTGLDLNELVDSLTASSISFGVSISAVGDKALGVQERFGVQAKETLQFFGDLSSVAADAGLSLDQLGAIAGTVQQATGKSGSSLAEGLGRIIPGIQEASIELVRFYQSTPALASKAPDIATAAGQGQTGAVLERLIRDYHLLDASQKKQVITLLGGRREAQILIPILENSAKVVEELDGQTAKLDSRYNDAGKSAKYFADLQKTLSQKIAELARQFQAFGQKLFEAGLGDVLKQIATVASVLLSGITLLAKAMVAFNDATGGAAIKVVELLAVLKLLQALGGRINLGRLLYGAVTPALGPTGAPVRVGGLLQNYGTSFVGARLAAGRAAAVGAGASGIGGAPLTAGAAALGINPVTAGLVVAGVGFSVYQQRTAKLEASASAFKKSLDGVDTKELQRLRDSRERKVNFWQRLWIDLPGGPTAAPEQILDNEIQHRSDAKIIHDFQAANKAGLVGGDPKKIASAISEANKGNKSAIDAMDLILADLKDKQGGALDSAIDDFNKAAATDNTVAKVNDDTFQQSVAAAEEAFQAGAISSTDYLKVLQDAQNAYQLALGRAGRLTDKQAKELAGILKQQAAFVSGKARELLDYNLSLKDVAGEGGPQAEIAGLTALLNDKTVTDPAVRLKAAQDLVAAEKKIQDVQLAAADTAVERLKILNAGFTIPDESRVAELQDAILNTDTGFRAVIDSVAFAFGNAANLAYLVASGAIADGITSMAELKKLIAKKMQDLLKLANENGLFDSENTAANEEYNRLQTLLKGLPSGPGTTVPGKKGKASPEDRAAAAKAAAKEAHATEEETARARFAYRKALLEGDPIAQADAAIEEAKYSESIASTAAEHLNAAKELLEANRAKAAAQATVADAYLDLDTALAAAAGDSVKVAQNELKGAIRHLDEARRRGDVVGAIAAQADVVAKEAAVADAELQSKTDDADFLHEMEQISDAQYLAIYKSILNTIPPEQIQKRRQLMLKIHQLEKGVADDLNFDIPSEIKLPKLYEVRRLRQTEAAGTGYGVGSSYQDNRQIMVQYNVLTPQDNQAALDDLLAVTSGQPRVGNSPRGY